MDTADKLATTTAHYGPFKIDTTPPTVPSLTSPAADAHITDTTPYFDWADSTDSGSGIQKYHIICESDGIGIDYVDNDTTSSYYDTPSGQTLLANGEGYYWRVVAYDNAGNSSGYSGNRHLWVDNLDTAPPNNPSTFGSTPLVNTWTSDNTIDVNWSGASDDQALKGYYYKWSTGASDSVGTGDSYVSTSSGSGSRTSSSLADGQWYFHIRYMDTADKLATTTAHYGPFKIDTTPPTVPGLTSPAADARITDTTPYFDWADSTDSGSGIQKYHIICESDGIGIDYVDNDTTSSYYDTPSGQTLLAGGEGYYWRVRTCDNAGNWSSYAANRHLWVDDPATTGAVIKAFDPQTGLVSYGSTGTVTVTMQNTGTTTRAFWVGLSFSGPSSGTWPDGWYDIPPQQTATLGPNDTQTFEFSFEIPYSLSPGQYTAHTAIWDGYNETDDLMVEPQYDYEAKTSFVVSGDYVPGVADDPYGLMAHDAGGLYDEIPKGNRGGLQDLEAHIANPLLDAKTGNALSAANDRVVVAIHGWNWQRNPTPLRDGEWDNVTAQLRGSKLSADWALVEYDWHNDAATGFIFWNEPDAKAAALAAQKEPEREVQPNSVIGVVVKIALISAQMAAEYDAIQSAERAYAHGIVLGKRLVDQIGAGNLKQVQLVGHSAGSWAVYSALRYISTHAPGCEVQVTYLDPFIPDQTSYNLLPLLNHAFAGQVLNQSVNYTRVTTPGAAKAEAYYTETDETELTNFIDWPTEATSVSWTWSGVPGGFVQEMFALDPLSLDWFGHSGPVDFFGDSISTPAAGRIGGLGWNKSLAYNTSVERIVRLTGDLAFGDVLVGGTAQRTLTIHNDGNDTLNVSSLSLPAGFSASWSGVIAGGGSQNVTVTFGPSGAVDYSGTVTVNSDATSGTNTRAVSGRGIARIIRLTGDLSFGDVAVGSSANRTLTIHNDGNVGLSVSGVNTPAGFSGSWSGTVSAGGSHDVTVTFSPTSGGPYSGTVTVSSDATSGTNTRGASGNGIGSIISLSGDLAFGSCEVGTTVNRTLTIHNDGTSPLNVSGISLPTGFTGNWSGSIAASGTRDVTITFAPMADRSYSGSASVNSDAQQGTSTRGVSGTGTITHSLDSDGDGVCDAHEAIAGTEKNNKDSYFHIAEVTQAAGGGAELRWASCAGRKYNVLICTDLTAGFSVLAPGLDADPPENTYTDPVARPTAFYLIEVYLPE